MRIVFGRVLVLEDGLPVPDLVVAAFDWDGPPDSFEPGTDSVTRLGSGFTGPDGSFQVEFTESEFRDDRDGDARPDLVLALYGPHVVGSNDDPDSAPVFVTRVPRIEAGRSEAYIVKVPRARLEEHHLLPGGRGSTPSRLSAEDMLRRHLAERARADRMMAEVLGPALRARVDTRKNIRSAIATMMARPLRASIPAADLFVSSTDDPTRTLARVREAGIERLGGLGEHMNGVAVRTTKRQLEQWGAVTGDDGSIRVDAMDAAGVFDVMDPEKWFGVRTRHPVDDCKNRMAARHWTAHHSGTEPEEGISSNGSAPEATVELKDEVLSAVRALIAGFPTNGTGVDGPSPTPAPTAVDLGVQFPRGPADVASYHDFHTLQVAWKDVWSAILDEASAWELSEIYAAIAPVMEWPSTPLDDAEIKDLEDFLQKLQQAAEAGAAIEDETDILGSAPDVFSWLPTAAPKWDMLSNHSKSWLRLYSLLYRELRTPWLEAAKELAVFGGQTLKSYFDWLDSPVEAEFRQFPDSWLDSISIHQISESWLKARGAEILAAYAPAQGLAKSTTPPPAPEQALSRAKRLLIGIAQRLREQYRFDVFVPGSYNFGVVTTYRQKWQPVSYQVGELVGTLPLAPGEKRTYSKKRVVKTTRAQKEIEKALSVRSGESTETTKAEAEILRKASSSTNFTLTAEGGFNVAIANASGRAEYGTKQDQSSGVTKRNAREAVRKAAEEYRRERTLEMSTEVETVDEFTETGEIRNTNDELTVTYLFYELQRRIEISERLHRITPVVLIAFDVPAPHEIDEDWLLAHGWILRRVILDDTLLPALEYLTDTFAGDELGVEVLRTQWEVQIETVGKLADNLEVRENLRRMARSELKRALEAAGGVGGSGVLETVGDFLFGDDDNAEAAAAEARRERAQHSLDWAESDFSRAEEQLMSGMSALSEATEAYTDALRRRLNRRVAIDELRIHVKDNILYYMQAIWLHEPPDQRYFRVYDKPIGWPQTDPLAVSLAPVPGGSSLALFFGSDDLMSVYVKVGMPVWDGGTRLLSEVVDVENLLGFKGNYAIFPLKAHNAVTFFMAQEYLDSKWGVKDPDPHGDVPSPSEALEIAECAWHDATDDEKKEITRWLLSVLDKQREVSEEIIVPTGELYIEALPGTHPLLESFKLHHRRIDVEKAAAELKQAQLEALRYAARLAAAEHGDPEVQTQIVTTDGVDVGVPVPPNP